MFDDNDNRCCPYAMLDTDGQSKILRLACVPRVTKMVCGNDFNPYGDLGECPQLYQMVAVERFQALVVVVLHQRFL